MASTDPFISSIDLWPVPWAPLYWALCQGQLIDISQNQALFSLIGTTYGGNGNTNFALPNMQGRVPVGAGTGPGLTTRILGHTGGHETTTLTLREMPMHTHLAAGSVTPKASTGGRGVNVDNVVTDHFPANANTDINIYADSSNTQMGKNDVEVVVQDAGNGEPFNNMPPFLVLNYIIALYGTYPPRN